MVTPAHHGQVRQPNHDSNQEDFPLSGPFASASSSLPMPLLPAVDLFTPLSMNSNVGGTATATRAEVNQAVPYSRRDTDKTAFNATVPATDSKELHSISTLNTLLPSPLGFSPSSAVYPSRQGDRVLSQASDLVKKESIASNMGHNFSSDATKDDGAKQAAEAPVEESSQPPITQQPVLVRPKPVVRTASTSSISLRHPAPDLSPRSSSHASNIAQLEATAERLSMTSSINDAIRELHDEQKRADSRRSSILAASIASIPENNESVFPISKQISASSIRETNTAARHGGYSPGGYVLSPNSSMVSSATRLRSGSTGMSKSDADIGGSLSRHGPGKSSVRSVRSITKPTLTNIAEIEPTALTAAAMDEADRLAGGPEDLSSYTPHMQITDEQQNANLYYDSNAHDYRGQAIAEPSREQNYVHERASTSAGSDGTFEQAERAFANFDGAHCTPEPDFEESLNFDTLFSSQMMEAPYIPPFDPNPVLEENKAEYSRPPISRPVGLTNVRPQSYVHPDTGEAMLYYPARVPMMLNLPQKLSKKPKAQARNARRSQVLSVMPAANRQSAAPTLPEFNPHPLLDPLGPLATDSAPTVPYGVKEVQRHSSVNAQDENQFPAESSVQGIDGDNRISGISMLNPKRGSQLPDLDNLPPQLRASAYFELPSQQLPTIQLKDGSATTTLDEILNASANAPVTAFTDHAFAGSLGTEVYGTERKRKSQMKNTLETQDKSRNSIFHIRKSSALSRHSSPQEERQDPGGVVHNGARQPLASSDGELVPGQDEREESEEPTYNGPPTTLLAELQMRKHQQKLRTRPAASAFPNGLHSTLLEMDTVAEVERRTRKGKKVNLAWENPDANLADDSQDEDTPLGLLFANKGQDGGLIGTLPGAPRPLGLMERRDMEDNEPLSVRRNRLQGREAGPIQRMTLVRGINTNPALRAPSPEVRLITPENDEFDDETLGERMRRLKAQDDNNPLPQARRVSSAFSAELLSQLGDTFKGEDSEGNDAGKGKDKSDTRPTEEEETLGQRRRRLQSEREAREREMARVRLNGGRLSVSPQLTKRHSLADILGGSGNRTILSDPRADAEQARQDRATRYKEDQERKLAALRLGLPTNLSTPNLTRPGGFMSGRFNDGAGGGFGLPRDSSMRAFGNDLAVPNHALNSSAMGNAFRVGGAMSPYGPVITNPYVSPYGPTSQVAQSARQMASIERWRQDVS
ncbi:hypothetical protein GGS21DRAFT_522340 [Xylaria nigripes]|nr:hypothetical protein GGS21DRAFT_522340 [Xylaria nigripes]